MLLVRRNDADVVRVPAEPGRQIRKIEYLLAGFLAANVQHERRPVPQISGNRGKDDTPVDAGLDAVAILKHDAVVVGEQRRGLAFRVSVGRFVVDDRHLPADVLVEHRRRLEQIEVEVLLDHVHRAGRAEVREDRGGCVHVRADVAPGDAVLAGPE